MKIKIIFLLLIAILMTGCVSVATPPSVVADSVFNENVSILNSTTQSNLFVEGNIEIGDLDTGINNGSTLCIDVNNNICACGSCA